jgi:hypothetical protein
MTGKSELWTYEGVIQTYNKFMHETSGCVEWTSHFHSSKNSKLTKNGEIVVDLPVWLTSRLRLDTTSKQLVLDDFPDSLKPMLNRERYTLFGFAWMKGLLRR